MVQSKFCFNKEKKNIVVNVILPIPILTRKIQDTKMNLSVTATQYLRVLLHNVEL